MSDKPLVEKAFTIVNWDKKVNWTEDVAKAVKKLKEEITKKIKQIRNRLEDKGVPEMSQANLSGMLIAYEGDLKEIDKIMGNFK